MEQGDTSAVRGEGEPQRPLAARLGDGSGRDSTKHTEGAPRKPLLELSGAETAAERARLWVVQAACVEGTSERKVDALSQALEVSRVEKSKASRICG